MGYFRGSRNSWQQSLSFKNKLNSKRYVMKFFFKKSRQSSTKRITISCACDCDTKTRKDFVVSRMTHQANLKLKIWLVCLDITQSNADCKFSGIVTNHVLAGMRMSLPYAGAGDMGKDKGGSISLCCYFAKKVLWIIYS